MSNINANGAGAALTESNRQYAAVLAGLSGFIFAIFPFMRPWGDKTGSQDDMAHAFAEPLWVSAHFLGTVAWAILGIAVLLYAVGESSKSRLAAAGWLALVGSMLLLPYYGAETFGLHGIASSAQDAAVVDAAQDAVRNGMLQTGMFGLGFLLLSISTVIVAVTSRSWQASVVALGVVTYLPQFFFPAQLRMAHGIIFGGGLVLWAMAIWSAERKASRAK